MSFDKNQLLSLSYEQLSQLSSFIKKIQSDREKAISGALGSQNLDELQKYHTQYKIKDIFWDAVSFKNIGFDEYDFIKYVLSCQKKNDIDQNKIGQLKNQLLESSLQDNDFYLAIKKDFNLSLAGKVGLVFKTQTVDEKILDELYYKKELSYHPSNIKSAIEKKGISYLEYGLKHQYFKIAGPELSNTYKTIIETFPVTFMEKFQNSFSQVTYMTLKELFSKEDISSSKWGKSSTHSGFKDYSDDYDDDFTFFPKTYSFNSCNTVKNKVAVEDFFKHDLDKIKNLVKTHVLDGVFIQKTIEYMTQQWDKNILNDKFSFFIECCAMKEKKNIELFKRELNSFSRSQSFGDIEKILFSIVLNVDLDNKKESPKIKI